MNREKDILGFGHFLEHRHWRQAVTLLEYQLERKKTNRHFNTLEMTYYQKMRKSFNRLKSDKYFITRVANNLFYGLSREFAVIPYTIPKPNLGLRRYKFMTCPMRVLYYAVGIYLIELSKDYLKASHGTQKARIHASYGGNLQFNEHGKLIKKPEPIPDPIYYKPHYDNFCKEVKKENEKNTERKVVIRLDIQNFFDELHIPMLLILLRDYVKPSISKKMCFDETTRAQLNSFFDFIGGGRSGIPQSDNNIISSFIGHLFLSFGDLYLDDELRKQDDLIANHMIIRYMDDIYISTAFKEQDRDLRTKFLNSIAPRISDCLHDKLGLRLNPKTRLFDLRIDGDREALERNLKRVSEGIEIVDEDNTPPKEKIKRIFGQLKKLKRFPIAPYFPEHPDPDSNEEEFNEEKFKDILKEVYDKRVEQMLKIPKKKLQLENLFTSSGGFDFELVNIYPMPIIVLIIASDDVRKKFDKFLRSKT